MENLLFDKNLPNHLETLDTSLIKFYLDR